MTQSSTRRSIGLVVEAPADSATVRLLVERVLEASEDWVDETIVEHLFEWRGIAPGSSVTHWKSVPGLAREHRVRSHGHFSGEPGAQDAQATRKALLLFGKLGVPDAIVLVRDADAQPGRLTGMKQARDVSVHQDRIAVGMAKPEREAWHLVGFTPQTPDEQTRWGDVRQRLGFDPCRTPERLGGRAKRDAKRALSELTGDDRGREHRCLADTTLSELRERGKGCGLGPFLDEVDERVCPRVLAG